MRDELVHYYERELRYLREMGATFAQKHSGIAGRLLLGPNECQDPHVERLLESFAFLAARIHLRIDDDFPELSESLLSVIHPSYLRPVPSMTIVECLPDPGQGRKTVKAGIPRGTPLVSKQTIGQPPCRFRSAYDVDLWPLEVVQAEWSKPERMKRPARTRSGEPAAAAALIRLRCLGDATLQDMQISRLRFHLANDPGIAYPLYELLSRNCIEIHLRDTKEAGRTVTLAPSCIRMMGFEADEALLPPERRSADGYRLIQEYFSFPEKFLFFELQGLEPFADQEFSSEVEIVFLFSSFEPSESQQVLENGVDASTFRLGCTPAINLFPHPAEPIQLNQTRHAYALVANSRHNEAMEIFSVEEVSAFNRQHRQTVVLDPMHTFRFQTSQQAKTAFWVTNRRFSQMSETEPSEVTISIVDSNGQLTDPESDVLNADVLCTNFNSPFDLSIGATGGDFDAVDRSGAKTITALRRPTKALPPLHGKGEIWKLISLLSLNYLSLDEGGLPALQEILRLHNLDRSLTSEKQIGSMLGLNSSPHFAPVYSADNFIPVRGTLVEILLDEAEFTGAGAYLFTAVLDRFLAGYCTINSFSQLTARTSQRKEPLALWPARAGSQALL